MNKQSLHRSMQRRDFLRAASLIGVAACLPRLSVAHADTDSRFVLIILRGALDGMAAVAPYGDGNYQRLRGELALPMPGAAQGALKLDGMFALHPSLSNLYARYQAKELLVLHAVASPYRERSHFDGQDLLENGTTQPHAALDGWLNRAVPDMVGVQHRATEAFAMAFAQNVPLVLRGEQRVGSWVPSRLPSTDDDTLQRIAALYASDPYFASRLHTAMATDALANESSSDPSDMAMQPNAPRPAALTAVASAAGKMLKQADGPRVAVMEATGWDTHANQGAERGQLATRLAGLDEALETLRVELGAAWQQTAVLVATEFGRTAAVNGTRGTDHGTATCALVVGGAVQGGKVLADWPGLANNNLYQGRDLKPTLDLRSVCKGILVAHLGVADALLETKVFVDSRSAKPLTGLMRSA